MKNSTSASHTENYRWRGRGFSWTDILTRENYRRKLPLFLLWCPMQKWVCRVSIQRWGSMDAFSICVVAKWQIWRTTLSSHKHSIPVAHTHIRAVIASCCVVDVCVYAVSWEWVVCPTTHTAWSRWTWWTSGRTSHEGSDTSTAERACQRRDTWNSTRIHLHNVSQWPFCVDKCPVVGKSPEKNPARIPLEHQTSIEKILGLNHSWIPEFILWIYFSLSPQKYHYS